MGFRKDFLWGVATAAVQIEGAYNEDGKKDSVWDVYCHRCDRLGDDTIVSAYSNTGSSGSSYIKNGDVADVSCDHYHRFREDVALMKELGVQVYRFSISWPRLIPDGVGEINPKAVEFYNNLIDELLKSNITPYVTLFHWDYPQALEDKGSWANPESPYWFEKYTEAIAKLFGDRVKNFITFNEPQCFIGAGYVKGFHAPGLKLAPATTIPMAHNVMLAHGLAVKKLRQLVPGCKVGYAPCARAYYPLNNTPEDIEMARSTYFEVTEDWANSVAWFSDPVMLGKYPEDGLKLFKKFLPKNYEEDLKIINQPLDFYAQNMYNGYCVTSVDGKRQIVNPEPGHPRTATDWWVTPEVLYWGPKFLYERYKTPFIITENGMSCHDAVSLDGKVHDPNRIDYINRYLLKLKQAADDGVDVRGYFVWSMMDNFEWALGYSQRFGIVHVDFATQKRTPKDSFYWLKDVIKTNGENL